MFPLGASAMAVNGSVQHPTCGLSNGSINTSVTGGTPPYTYLWTPNPPNGQGTPSLTGLGPSSWSVTVTDNLGVQATNSWTLVNQQFINNVGWAVTWGYNGSAAHHPCPGFQNGSICVITSMITGGTPPYTVTVNGQGPLGYDINTNEPYFGYFTTTDEVWVDVTDANGCTGSGVVMNDGPTSLGATASNINPACGGLPNGSAELTFGFAGPYGPYLQVWDDQGAFIVDETPWMEPLQLTGLTGGLYSVYGQYSPVYFDNGCDYYTSFTVPDLGPDCGTVSGHLYIDNNQNCVQNAGEPSIPYHVIEINPGPEYAITNSAGNYTRNLINGNFTLEAQGTGTDLYPICPAVQPAPFTINYNNVTVDLADSSLIPLDVRLMAHSGVAQPGFAHSIWGNVRNMTAQLSGAVTLSIAYDPQMNYVGANPVPTSVAGNTLTWDLAPLIAYDQYDFSVQLLVPANAGLIGLPFNHSGSVSQPLAESTLINNSVGLSGVFVGAYDPNDKTAFTSSGWSNELYYIGQDEWIDYVIRFQNTGTATATNVVVTDTISEELDLATFQQGAASHPFEVEFKEGRVVEWSFENIMLPDSGANEAASHGLVSFRIKPTELVLPGTVLANNADIFFDFNDPVRTNDAVLVTEFSTATGGGGVLPEIAIAPNPGSDHLSVTTAGSFSLRVTDMFGRQVAGPMRGSERIDLAVSELPPGIFLVQVTLAEGWSFTRPWSKH